MEKSQFLKRTSVKLASSKKQLINLQFSKAIFLKRSSFPSNLVINTPLKQHPVISSSDTLAASSTEETFSVTGSFTGAFGY